MPYWLTRLRLRLRALLSRRHDREVQDELALHIDLLADEYRQQGLPEDEARARAHREFGNVTRLGETVHEVSTFPWLEGVLRDIAYAGRELRRSRGVTMVAVLSLALGIGANTAIFSIVNALMLRELPVAEPRRLAALAASGDETIPGGGARWSYGLWQAVEQRADAFDGAIAWSAARFDLSNGGEVDPVSGVFASGDFFRVLGVPAIAGRTFTAADDVRGAADGPVAVISYGLWQTRFGGAPSVVGASIDIQGTPFTIVGVTGPRFTGLEVGQAFDVVLPLAAEPLIRGAQSFINPPLDRMNYWLRIVFRLKPDQSVESADALVRGLQLRLREASVPQGMPEYAEQYLKEPLSVVPASTGMSLLRQTYQRPLAVLLAVVALVLLLACANIANLLLARATARGHELNVRLALGATRWRVARQLLAESVILAAAGAVAGLLLAAWAGRALVAQLSTESAAVSLDLPLDWRVLGFTVLMTTVTAVLCGVAPAFRVTGARPIDALKEQGRSIAGDRRASLSAGLLVTQVALSLTLVVTAGLFVGTFARLASVPLGFDGDRVLLINANAGRAALPPEARAAFYDRLVAAAGGVPGVAAAAASTSTPVGGSNMSLHVGVAGVAPAPDPERNRAKYIWVTPEWFATYGVPLLSGRDISSRDAAGALPVAVVNSAFVERFFPDRNVLGESITVSLGPGGEMSFGARTIVGVVGNTVYRSLREETQPVMYFPIAQWNLPIPLGAFVALSVRPVAGTPAALSPRIADALTAIEPRLALTIRTLDDQVQESVHQERLIATLSGLFGVLALLLAGLGLYGVTSYGVTRRQTEIGVRLALGATPMAVVRLVLSRVFVLVMAGVCIGAGLSAWLSRFAASLLYGLAPGDPATLAGAAAALIAVALAAAIVPARRALGIDPVETLREH